MKKINLKGVSKTLNEREMKNVRGGLITDDQEAIDGDGGGGTPKPCDGKKQYQCCTSKGKTGACRYVPFVYELVCDTNQPCQ